MNFLDKIKNIPKQEMMAYLAIALGVILIIIAVLIW